MKQMMLDYDTKNRTKKLVEATRKWLCAELFNENHCRYAEVTIRLNPCDDYRATRTLRHFLNLVNRQLLKSQHRHSKKYLATVAILEGITKYNRHHHLLLENPVGFNLILIRVIRDAWLKTRRQPGCIFRNERPHITLGADYGWLRYITKPQTKRDYADALDVRNLDFPNGASAPDKPNLSDHFYDRFARSKLAA
jgi:hypothetical protein